MIILSKYNKEFVMRQLHETDYPLLQDYLSSLSYSTTERFGPHGFDMPSIRKAYRDFFPLWGFVALDCREQQVVAYTLIKLGLIAHERERLRAYPGEGADEHLATYAPSVADHWQGQGLAAAMLKAITPQLRQRGIRGLVLWGGVMADNQPAIRFYNRQGFQTLGQFEHNGTNLDMVLKI